MIFIDIDRFFLNYMEKAESYILKHVNGRLKTVDVLITLWRPFCVSSPLDENGIPETDLAPIYDFLFISGMKFLVAKLWNIYILIDNVLIKTW